MGTVYRALATTEPLKLTPKGNADVLDEIHSAKVRVALGASFRELWDGGQ